VPMSAAEWAIGISSAFVVCAGGLAYVLVRWRSRRGQSITAAKREVHLPVRGLPEEGIGVGDAVKRVTDAFRIKPCNGCERRRNVLNRWVIKGKARPSDGNPATR
jgi:hypothetical protein